MLTASPIWFASTYSRSARRLNRQWLMASIWTATILPAAAEVNVEQILFPIMMGPKPITCAYPALSTTTSGWCFADRPPPHHARRYRPRCRAFLVGVAQNHTAGFAQTLCQLRHRVRAIGTVLAAVGFRDADIAKVDSSVMTVRL